MDKAVDNEFLGICTQIVHEDKTEDDWALVEADDYFNTDRYSGGFDATEMAFCFSYYDDDNVEYFFQVTLAEAGQIAQRSLTTIKLRLAD